MGAALFIAAMFAGGCPVFTPHVAANNLTVSSNQNFPILTEAIVQADELRGKMQDRRDKNEVARICPALELAATAGVIGKTAIAGGTYTLPIRASRAEPSHDNVEVKTI